jgi:hypothetical protein
VFISIPVPLLIIFVLGGLYICLKLLQQKAAEDFVVREAIMRIGRLQAASYSHGLNLIPLLANLAKGLNGSCQRDALWELIRLSNSTMKNRESFEVLQRDIPEAVLRKALLYYGLDYLKKIATVYPANSEMGRRGLQFALLALNRRSSAELDNEISQADADALHNQLGITTTTDHSNAAIG